MLVQEKIGQAKALLREFDVDCWITFVRETEINGDPTLVYIGPAQLTWHSALIISKDGRTHAIVGKQDVRTVEDLGAWDEVVGFVTGIREPLLDVLRKLDPGRVALNYSEGSEICDGITHGMFLTIEKLLSEAGMADRIVSAEPIISALRERKTPWEADTIREAIRHTLEIFALTRGFIRPGRTEKQIAAFMQAEVSRRGLGLSWEASTCPGVFTGPDTAGAHYGPTDRQVARGHVLNMDFGVRVNGYVSDLQRTFYILGEGETIAPHDVRHGFDTIVDAIQQCKDAMRPDVQGLEVDAIARRVLSENGFEEFPHGLGHQVGRFAHDGTALLGPAWEKYAGKPFKKLEPGMVFTIEPRLTVPGRGVCTIEEMVLVTENGCDWLSQPQKELILIG
jgi:Xaa-Pro aminopeptidase